MTATAALRMYPARALAANRTLSALNTPELETQPVQ